MTELMYALNPITNNKPVKQITKTLLDLWIIYSNELPCSHNGYMRNCGFTIVVGNSFKTLVNQKLQGMMVLIKRRYF